MSFTEWHSSIRYSGARPARQLSDILRAAACWILHSRTSSVENEVCTVLHWLDVPASVTFKLCLLAHRCLLGSAPPCSAGASSRGNLSLSLAEPSFEPIGRKYLFCTLDYNILIFLYQTDYLMKCLDFFYSFPVVTYFSISVHSLNFNNDLSPHCIHMNGVYRILNAKSLWFISCS